MQEKKYYNKETGVMINQSVNDFYSRFLFNIDALLNDELFLMDIAETLFKKITLGFRDLLVS